ncbi:MAG: hypothetical protein Q8P95_02550 [bacterium]|nr:hypothetical protein [bacterium]
MKFFERLLFGSHLSEDEVLFCTIHRHWSLIAGDMIKIALFGYILPILIVLYVVGPSSPLSYFFYAWIVLSFLLTLYTWFNWYGDAILCTNHGVINVTWDGFLDQSSILVEYRNIESVSYRRTGVRETFLNCGEVSLVRASGMDITIADIDQPQRAAKLIAKYKDEILNPPGVTDRDVLNKFAKTVAENIVINT